MTNAIVITELLDDYGVAKHETHVLIMRIPALAFLYLVGKAEAKGLNGKL